MGWKQALRNKVIAIVGTNASGKSSLGVELALHFHGEIISADSRQVYRGLDLGSGKITIDEAKGVPHHMIDILDPGEFFSMADFQRISYQIIPEIIERAHVPIIVGGTGLYVDSVLDGYILSDIVPDLDYRNELEKKSTQELWGLLEQKAPDANVDSKNRNRVMRLLERIHDGDTLTPQKAPRYESLRLGVRWPKEILDQRIDERIKVRLDAGMIEEVERLLDSGVSVNFLLGLGLEYRFITNYILGRYQSKEAMIQDLAKAIKKFAKRQITWFKRNANILWLDMQNDPKGQAIEAISRFLKN